jgi:hypothetical protein
VLIPTQARSATSTRRGWPPTSAACRPPRRAHRRRERQADHLRRRRARPRVPHRRAHPEGFFRLKDGTGLDHCIARGLAFAPHADLLWWETSHPNLDEARTFAEAVHKQYPGKLLAYNCSPSFNWAAKLDKATIAKFQRELGAMGYKFQFVTLAGFHSLNHGMFELARGYRDRGMAAYSELQQAEFASEPTATPRPATSARSAPAISTSDNASDYGCAMRCGRRGSRPPIAPASSSTCVMPKWPGSKFSTRRSIRCSRKFRSRSICSIAASARAIRRGCGSTWSRMS